MKTETKSRWGGRRTGAGRPPKARAFSAFEGSQITHSRAYVYYPTVEARREVSTYTRLELLRRARWLLNNVGLASAIIDGVARNSVGTGIVPQARSGDRAWNKEAERLFEDTVGTTAFAFDVSGAVNYYEAQGLIVRQMLCDGDFFGQLRKSDGGNAMVRFWGAESVGPGRNGNDGKDGWFDGVRANDDGRPLLYRVLLDQAGEKYQDVPADDVMHFRRLKRFGHLRGVSILSHAINHMLDQSEVTNYVKGSFKLQSMIPFWIQTPQPGQVGLGANLRRVNSTDGTAQLTYDDIYQGAGIPQLPPNTELKGFKPEQPAAGFEALMSYLERDIARGCGVDESVIGILTGTGPAVRTALEKAQVLFSEVQDLVINQFCTRFWRYWTWLAMKNGALPEGPEDWWRVEHTRPKKITIDRGRDGRLEIDLLQAGMSNFSMAYGGIGEDWESAVEQKIREVRHIMDRCDAEGVPVDMVLGGKAAAAAAPEATQPPDPPQGSPTDPA